ncbi:PhnD/SsuA/transferrin family substrate-binding protein [Halovenus salina]|uniref:PhnD/SsuA/transferrin family substrate-binding protein n=1 Tax=Halovenus salina TaxID=1510225 RepID=A0ABD5VZI1_9EURY|nr:PhnD/SsuA/transferrin family substrate-binding protein [Halovenus salina]
MADKRANWKETRRKFIATTGIAGTSLLAGCIGGDDGDDGEDGGDSSDGEDGGDSSDGEDGGDSSDGEDGGDTTEDTTTTIGFALNPAEANVEIEAQYQPLFDYLESELSIKVEPLRAASYTATTQEIRRGGVELADTSPFVPAATDGIADVVGIREAYGSDKYFSIITTTTDSGIEQLSDLESETIAFAAPTSTSGSLVPTLMLKNAGLEVGSAPQGDPPDFTARYSDHTTARKQMVNDPSISAAATGAFSAAPHVPQKQFDQMSDSFSDLSSEYEGAGEADPQLNLLAVSNPLPRAPIMARSDWNADIRSDVESALINAEPGGDAFTHEEGYEGEELWFTNIKEGSESDYEPIEKVLNQLEVEIGDL